MAATIRAKRPAFVGPPNQANRGVFIGPPSQANRRGR
jgi:hypothetical protein